MINVLISLLKGRAENKYKLLKEGDRALDIIKNGSKLKELYRLEKGRGFEDYDKILEILNKKSIGTLTYGDNLYPGELMELNDPPFLLYYIGDISVLTKVMVSVVGTRKPTLKGLYGSFQLGLDLGKCGISVVSGLAKGVDGASHLGNINGGGKTIAVLGNGIDYIYPKENRDLASKVVKSGGVIISEFPPMEEVRPYNFPKRNRIVAALSRATVIIQAPNRSGSLITADMALDLGKDVYIHFSGIGDRKFSGSDSYAKDGGKVIERGFPIATEYGISYEFEEFNPLDFSDSELLEMEIKGEVVKYRGNYFKL